MNTEMINKYLKRIKYNEKLSITKETLFSLHQYHVFNICFENLDIQLGYPLSLEIDNIFEKVVNQNRGGYCFEINALFASVLEHIGFEVEYCGSRVWYGYNSKDGMRPRAHQILLITVDNIKYLVDTSFGNGFFLPLEIENSNIQNQFGRKFFIKKDNELGYMVYMDVDNSPFLLFSFTQERCYPADYEVGSFYASNSKSSIFTQKLVCTLPNEKGRKIILNNEYSNIIGNDRNSITITSNDQLLDILINEFNIKISDEPVFPLFKEVQVEELIK